MAARGAERSLVLDTSCVVALVSAWHEHHARTVRAVDQALRGDVALVVPVHCVLEAYAVLTRLPPPHRLRPDAARELLTRNFAADVQLAAPSTRAVWPFLNGLAGRAVAGGRTYDAWIAEAARTVRPATLLTWNLDHLAAFADEDLMVRTP
jgi:predicted nucleic acid-binding protein